MLRIKSVSGKSTALKCPFTFWKALCTSSFEVLKACLKKTDFGRKSNYFKQDLHCFAWKQDRGTGEAVLKVGGKRRFFLHLFDTMYVTNGM